MNTPKKNREFVDLGSILKQVLSTYRKDSNEKFNMIVEKWDEIIEDSILENARPAAIKGKTLLVEVSCSAWIHHLHFIKKDIISKMNDALGINLIEDIKLTIA